MTLKVPSPDLQIDFSFSLRNMRNWCLREALSNTMKSLDIAKVDTQLAKLVPAANLSDLASHHLRGELVFPVPTILEANPRL